MSTASRRDIDYRVLDARLKQLMTRPAMVVASSSGNVSVQVRNDTGAVDMLTTNLTIDQGETDSSTAATPAAIDGANAFVSTADMLRIDIDAEGTGTKGLMVELTFGYHS